MRLAIKTCTLDMSFEDMLKFCVDNKIEAVEIGTGNWSGAPHIDLDKVSTSDAARDEWYGKIKDAGLELCALNCSGNPLAYEKDWDVTLKTFDLASKLGVKTVVMMSGLPTGCELDIWGGISMLILKAAALGEDAPLLADWTYRHPTNPNGELIWHGGPFAYSLADKTKHPEIKKRFFGPDRKFFEPHWELKQGHLTMFRMDELDGEYYTFVGDADTIEGPATTSTYVWVEVKPSWKRWEEKLMFGPFIHHVGGIYGDYNDVLEEVVRYLNNSRRGVKVHMETPYTPGPKSL